MHGVNSRLQMTLVSIGLGVDGGHVIDGRAGIGQLHVSLLLATISRVEERAGLFKLTLESVGFPVGKAKLLGNFLKTICNFVLKLNLQKIYKYFDVIFLLLISGKENKFQ